MKKLKSVLVILLAVVIVANASLACNTNNPVFVNVTFDLCGGEWPADAEVPTRLEMNSMPTLPTPIWGGGGYLFTRWYLDASKTQTWSGKVPANDFKLYADWEEDEEYINTVAANAVVLLIEALPATITTAHESSLNTIRDAYEALTAEQKALVTNYNALVSAETALVDYKNKLQADAVVVLINAIPATITVTTGETEILLARAAYELLTADQKAFVSSENYEKLVTAEASLKLAKDQAAADLVIAKIESLPATVTENHSSQVTTASEAFESLTADQKALISAELKNKLSNAIEQYNGAVADIAEALINSLPADIALDFEAEVLEARRVYDALTDAQKALVSSTALEKLVSAEAVIVTLKSQIAVSNVIELIRDLTEAGSLLLSEQAEVIAVRVAYDQLTADEKALVTNYSKLQEVEAKMKILVDTDASEYVSGLIASLPSVENATLAHQPAVVAVRTAFDGLTVDQKALVTTESVLIAVENEILALIPINIYGGGHFLAQSPRITDEDVLAVVNSIKLKSGNVVKNIFTTAVINQIKSEFTPRAGYEYDGIYYKNADGTFNLVSEVNTTISISDTKLDIYVNDIICNSFTNGKPVAEYNAVTIDGVEGWRYVAMGFDGGANVVAYTDIVDFSIPAYYRGKPVITITSPINVVRLLLSATNFYIPNTIIELGRFAEPQTVLEGGVAKHEVVFEGNSQLKRFVGTFSMFSSFRIENIVLPEGLEVISQFAFQDCTTLESISLPSTLIEIRNGAFGKSGSVYGSLKSITIPASVTKLGDWGNRTVRYQDALFLGQTQLETVTFEEGSQLEEICDFAFGTSSNSTASALRSLTAINGIPNTLKKIGNYAFAYTSALTSITLPSSIEYIGLSAFEKAGANGSSLILNINDDVEYALLDEVATAFKANNFSIVTMSNITKIHEEMFRNSANLTTVRATRAVASIGDYAFAGTKVNDLAFYTEANITYGTNLFFEASFENFEVPTWMTDIPASTFADNSVVTSITLHNGITSIHETAFASCSALTRLEGELNPSYFVLANDMIASADGSSIIFDSNPDGILINGVQTKIFGEGIKSIPAVYKTGTFTKVVFSYTVESIANSAFQRTNSGTVVAITEIVFEGNATNKSRLKSIGANAFERHALTSITFPAKEHHIYSDDNNNVLTMGIYAFRSRTANPANLDFVIPAYFGVSDVNTQIFAQIEGTIKFEEGSKQTSLSSGLFTEYKGTKIELPDSVKRIENGASNSTGVFMGTTNLVDLKLSDNVEYIGDYAFSKAGSGDLIIDLRNITKLKQFGKNVFDACNANEIYIPDFAVSTADSFGTKLFNSAKATIIEVGNCPNGTIDTLPSSTANLQHLKIGDLNSLTASKGYSEASSKLVSVTLGAIKQLSDDAFGSATRFASPIAIYLTASLADNYGTASKDHYIFRNADVYTKTASETTLLDEIIINGTLIYYRGIGTTGAYTVPANVNTIAKFAFEGNTALTTVNIPNTVTYISSALGASPFTGCANLTTVNISAPDVGATEKLTALPAYIFNGMASLTTVNYPTSIVEIGNYAFTGCLNLTGITLHEGLTTIGNYAFAGNTTTAAASLYASETSISSFTLPASLTSLGTHAFLGAGGVTEILFAEGFSITKLPDYVFAFTSLSSINIPDCVTSFGTYTFAGTKFTTFTMPDQITSVGNYFMYKNTLLESFTLNPTSKLTALGGYMFQNCTALKTVVLHGAITTIGSTAFSGTGLELLVINKQTSGTRTLSVGSNAFQNCNSLKAIIINGKTTIHTSSNTNLGLTDSGVKVFLEDADTVTAFKDGKGWSTFTAEENYQLISTLPAYVESLIDAIPTQVAFADKGKIVSARVIYDVLTTEQKGLVDNYTKLTDAEEALSELS